MTVEQSPLHIRLLGDLRIFRGDELVPPISSVRAQSLLAYLVLHAGVPQSRRHLAFLLWPDSSDEQSRSNLRKLLHDLRKALPDVDRFIDAEGPNLLWRSDAPYTLDVAELEQLLGQSSNTAQLQRAVSLYQGPLFQSCYDDWVLPERERLHQLFIDALGRLVEQLETQGDYRTAIQQAQLLLQHDPLHEDVYRALMRLYALTDDRAAALRTYQTCRAVLKKELDVEPSPATQQAYDRLLALKTPAHSLPNGAALGTSAPLPPALTPLVGRSAEWTRLQSVWKQVAKGQVGWVLLSGAPGVGKTRLAEELVSWAAKQGIPTASARCYAAESALGYGPITTWLRSRPVPALDPVWLAELARLLPELRTQYPHLAEPGPLTEPWQRLRFFEALARAVLASQPLVLFLDDLQYCDRDTLEFLHYVVRSNPHAALLLVSTVCREEIRDDSALPGLVTALRRAGSLTELAVVPLSREETHQLASQLEPFAAESAQAESLFRTTEGNPLFILEMVRAGLTAHPSAAPAPAPAASAEEMPEGELVPALPRTMEAVMAARLAQLSPETHQLAQVASVIGREFPLDVLARASGTSEASLVKSLSELRTKRIVRMPRGEVYDFDHSALRQVAYAQLNPAEKQMWHRKVAEALETLAGGRTNGTSAEIARHFAAAGLKARAVPYQVHAGDAARRLYAHPAAIRFYRLALPYAPASERGELYLRLGKVLELTGESGEAETHYYKALEHAVRNEDEHARAEAEMALGELFHRQGHDGDALKWLERARRRFESLEDRQGLARVFQDVGIIYDLMGDDPRALAYHQSRLAIAFHDQDRRGISQALGNIGLVYWHQANHSRALDLYARQLSIAEELDDCREQGRALQHQGMVYFEQGDYTHAAAAFRRAYDLAQETGDRLSLGYLAGHLGRTSYAQGDHRQAFKHFSHELEVMTELGASRGIGEALRELGVLYHDEGETDQALLCLTKSLQLAVEMQDKRLVAPALGNLAVLIGERGDEQTAMRLWTRAIAFMRSMNMLYALSEQFLAAAVCNYRSGCYAETKQLNADAMKTARQINRHDVIWRSKVLAALVRGVETPRALRDLEAMLEEERGEQEQAAIHYALWRLDRTREFDRKHATRLYRLLHARAPKSIYRTRYRELTGSILRAEMQYPELPNIVKEGAADLITLLAQVEAFWEETRTPKAR